MSNSSAWITSCTTMSISAYFVINGQLSFAAMIAFSNLMNNVSYPLINMSNIINGIKSLESIETKILSLISLKSNKEEG